MNIRLIMVLLISVLLLSACFDNNAEAPFEVDDLPETADIQNGEHVFRNGGSGAPACLTCHTLNGDDTAAGPSLKGFGKRASSRVEGESEVDYAFYSIVAPGRHTVEGYGNRMYGDYAEKLSKQQIADLIAYLLTLDD